MKIIATLLNIAFLIFISYMFAKDSTSRSANDIFMFILAVFFPLANLWCIYYSKITASDNFIVLYFKRRSLEEKMKIAALQEKDKVT